MKQVKYLLILFVTVAITTSVVCWLVLFLFLFFNVPVQSEPVIGDGVGFMGLVGSLVGIIYSWVFGVPLYLLASRVTSITVFKAAGLGFLSVLPLLLVYNIRIVMVFSIIAVLSASLASAILKVNMRLWVSLRATTGITQPSSLAIFNKHRQ